MDPFFLVVGIVVVVAVVVILFLSTYTVVVPNEAHVVVRMGGGRKIYSSTAGYKSAYFYIPFLMKKFMLPLANVKMEIRDIHLNDSKLAPFLSEVICWLHISDAIKAAERLNLVDPFVSLEQDLINIVQAVARAVAMKQEILDIMKDRQTFSGAVSKEVGTVLEQWGVELINLEVNDIRDDNGKQSTVISSYESIRKAEVSSLARQQVAIKAREAIEVEADNTQKAEIARTVADETIQKRQIERDQVVGVQQQKKESVIATESGVANLAKVEANRKITVGNAEVTKEATITQAQGESEAIRVKGEKEADVVTLKGKAEASVIEAKGTAEAVAKDKMASAVAKFNEAGTTIEKIKAWVQVETVKYQALGDALSHADLKLVTSGQGGNLFGFPLNAETGANIGQMIEGMGGLDKLVDLVKGKKNSTSETKTV